MAPHCPQGKVKTSNPGTHYLCGLTAHSSLTCWFLSQLCTTAVLNLFLFQFPKWDVTLSTSGSLPQLFPLPRTQSLHLPMVWPTLI